MGKSLFEPLPPWKELYYSVRRFFDSGPFRYRWYRDGLANTIRWLPVIWRDQDFDHVYMLDMWATKFQHMADFFNSEYAMTCNASERAKELQECADACRRISLDEYDREAMDAYDAKWGKLEMGSEPTEHGTRKLVFHRAGILNTYDEKRHAKEYLAIAQQADKDKQADINRLCKAISKRLLYWWD